MASLTAAAGPSPSASPASGWGLLAEAFGEDAAQARRAAAALIQMLRPRAYALAFRMMGNAAHAEDVVQESFLRLWRHRPHQKGSATLSTYFYRVVMNEALRALGKVRPQEILCEDIELHAPRAGSFQGTEADSSAGEVESSWLSASPSPCGGLSADPLDLQVSACDAEAVQSAISQIPERQRAVLLLWAYDDLDVREIASVMGLQDNAVHQLLFRARASLRKLLAESADSGSPKRNPSTSDRNDRHV